MKRKQIPQISNQKWFPLVIKNCMYEFMTWFVNKVNAAKPFLPVINEGLRHEQKIIAIRMNVGAGFETLIPLLDKNIAVEDVFIENFNAEKKGLYVCVNSFHQLDKSKAFEILDRVSKSGNSIVIVEGNNDSLWQVFGMTVIVPLTVLLTAPFVKPFRWSRLLFTYIIPVLPIVTFVDGFIALFKLYAPDDLNELIAKVNTVNYYWRSGKMDNGRGGKIIYLIGYPK